MSRDAHSLSHLGNDVRNHDPLDTLSAFSFECYLFKIKAMMKGNKNVTSQLSKSCSRKDSSGIWLHGCGQSFSFYMKLSLSAKAITISISIPTNVALVNRLSGIVKTERNELGVGRIRSFHFNHIINAFDDALFLGEVHTFFANSLLEHVVCCNPQEINCKCVGFTRDDGHCIISSPHSLTISPS